jgi:hypothetical protein
MSAMKVIGFPSCTWKTSVTGHLIADANRQPWTKVCAAHDQNPVTVFVFPKPGGNTSEMLKKRGGHWILDETLR